MQGVSRLLLGGLCPRFTSGSQVSPNFSAEPLILLQLFEDPGAHRLEAGEALFQQLQLAARDGLHLIERGQTPFRVRVCTPLLADTLTSHLGLDKLTYFLELQAKQITHRLDLFERMDI